MSNIIPIRRRDDYLIATPDDHAERKRREAIITAAQNWHSTWAPVLPPGAMDDLRLILDGTTSMDIPPTEGMK